MLNITICPTCDRKKTLSVVRAPHECFRDGGLMTVPDVPRLRCSACGDEFFDPESIAVMNAYAAKVRHGRLVSTCPRAHRTAKRA